MPIEDLQSPEVLGMSWTMDGANAIIALRCGQFSNRFNDYWEEGAAA